MSESRSPASPGTDFIRQIVARDVADGRYPEVVTRFPPEPNGYMHIGHAKSVCLNFGLAAEFGGRCHLRYDDTNPETEREEFVLAFQDDIRWLGFEWGEHLYFASDYFERMYECAEVLIGKGLAYVDSQTEEEIREGRGTVTEPGIASPYRSRPVDENLELLRRMRAGDFADGTHVLRARIDMAAPNMLMRDPVLYRIRHASHYRRGDAWCIYPLYDYAHCLEDAFEGVTHSICTLEFENNREIYDWLLEHVGFHEPRPHQHEFARLELEHAVLSKRKIAPLVEAGVVSGWDDPRLSTVRGIRRRGVPAQAVRDLCDLVGVARTNSTVDAGKFEYAIRNALNHVAPRVMAVLDPLRVVLTDWPEGRVEELDAPYFPRDVGKEGSRAVPFSGELLIERADFSDDPPKGFRRLVPGGEVRLRYAYVIRCDEVVRDDAGTVVELRCSHDPDSRGGTTSDQRKVKGTVQWVSAAHARPAEVRLYDRLFDDAEPGEVDAETALGERVNPDSLVVVEGARVEPSIEADQKDTRYQFERIGYFWRDPVDGVGDSLVFNRIVSLRDTWGRRERERSDTRTEDEPEATSTDAARAEKGEAPAAEPDSGPSAPTASERDVQRAADPELAMRMDRYVRDLGLSEDEADLLTGDRGTSELFEEGVEAGADPGPLAAWMVNELRGLVVGRSVGMLPFDGRELAALVGMAEAGTLTRPAAKEVLAALVERGGDPAELARELGVDQAPDDAELEAVVADVLAAWPAKVEEYRGGKRGLIGLFMGEVMKSAGGGADPQAVRGLLEERLERGG